MLLNSLMDGEQAANVAPSINRINDGYQHGTIKALLNNFLSPDAENMAIKEKQTDNRKCTYSIPIVTPRPPMSQRMKSINEAKLAFLNSTVSPNTQNLQFSKNKDESVVHYAQLAVTTANEDTRSTGGGVVKKKLSRPSSFRDTVETSPNAKKGAESHRKVSFKIKNASSSYKKPPITTRTMTITGSKVSELTKKFNNLVNESQTGSVKSSKFAKTIEELQSVSKCSSTNTSTPSSTVSSSPNIKIVVRHRRGSKKRNGRKRCSSMDSVDKLLVSDSSSEKVRIIRSKSDGNKIPKSPKKRTKNQSASDHQSGSDSVDGLPILKKDADITAPLKESGGSVRNVINKFEHEIIQSNPNSTLNRRNDKSLIPTPPKEKPKVPEKKSSLVLTKNIVVKDGVPKIKTLKPSINNVLQQAPQKMQIANDIADYEKVRRKESIYDKMKTNYIHPKKLPLKVVEIIPDEIANISNTITMNEQILERSNSEEKMYQDISFRFTPNESFLWRRKSGTYVYSDSEKSTSEGPYSFISITTNDTVISFPTEQREESQTSSLNESHDNISDSKCDQTLDFETDLVEAYNKEVLIGYTPKPKKTQVVEDDYEPLEPIADSNNVLVIPVNKPPADRTSKANCPLPEIPKEETINKKKEVKENIYQCLLEMRSHPEGDESSIHSYELYDSHLEERTRGDGDSDDGYEYCKSPIKPYCLTSSSGIQIAEDYRPPYSKGYGLTKSVSGASTVSYEKIGSAKENYIITKSISGASTVSYEKIGSDRIYEKIPFRPPKPKDGSPNYSNRHSIISSEYNDGENIYDTIKHSDTTSLSHCYESIPNSPSFVKLRNNLRKQIASNAQKRLSFDTVSNVSLSTMSSEVKTNSIYGQRSVISYNGQEIAFQVPSSETSVSDRSDRSDDWVDVSDEEKNEEHKIIIVKERGRGKKSPVSWSQKVRHQWHNSPKQRKEKKESNVFITSPTKVYIDTSSKAPYYSQNDEEVKLRDKEDVEEKENVQDKCLEDKSWLSVRTVLRDGDFETQDLVSFIECDSSDSGHLYESLDPPLQPAPAVPSHIPTLLPYEDDFDSFDSDTDSDDDKPTQCPESASSPSFRLPNPPASGAHTLTKIANAAQKKMRQIKRNLTKRYSVALDGRSFLKSSNDSYGSTKSKKSSPSPIYANCETPEQHTYSNINFPDTKSVLNDAEIPLMKPNGFKDELKNVMIEKRLSAGDCPLLPDKPTTPTCENSKKDSGTLSRKTYFSFKSRFRRATSLAVDINDVPSVLKITNSTFYLTDSMDGDSGFSNCSDAPPSSTETLSPLSRRDGTRSRLAESSPCLAHTDRTPHMHERISAQSHSVIERPNVPPPPPPQGTDLTAVNEELKRLLPTLSRKEKTPRTRTSWYAECGATVGVVPETSSSSSWYAESGLVQAGNISSSSGASSGSHPASPLPHSLFTHEPLYQFYNAAKVESVCHETGDSDSDAYDGAGQVTTTLPASLAPPSRPSAMALVAPRGPARTLWCEVPEVVNSAVLSSLAPAQKRLQEAKFELLTSEASYLNSLNVLEAHFISHPAFRDPAVLTKEDWETLFSAILPVRRCSQLLMNELEKCWQENILLQGICEIVRKHAEKHFNVYIKYCENQALMVRTLQRLREKSGFSNTLKRLESHPACQSLSLHSFLMLPMQRVTRLPLLMDAVLKNLHEKDQEYQSCMLALATLNHFVSQCNEGARNTERIEEMFRLAHSIEFPPHIKHPPVIGPACGRRDRRPVRWLVRSGEMTHLVWKADEMKLTFGKKFSKTPLHLFLFNDLLVITKKKGEGSYVAVDHCPRSLLEVCSSEGTTAAKHTLLLTLLENHEGRTLEMLMSCPTETDASRWGEALSPPGVGSAHEDDGEAVYAGWDCPQVCAQYAYSASQPDELPLAEGDIINVTRKTSEGWFYGERTRDGEAGWFPGAYTVEIASPHVRARNLRQRYRLLALSGTYLGQKKRPT